MEGRIQHENGIRKAFYEARRQAEIFGADQVFDLSIGNPGAPAPDDVREALLRIADDPAASHGYMSEAGYEDTRQALADSIRERFNCACTADDLVMTVGAAGGLNAALLSVIDPGDEVIVFRPYYPAYREFIDNWNGTIVEVDPAGPQLMPDMADLRAKLSPRTKAVLVNTPQNPTGAVYDEATCRELAACLNEAQDRFGTEIALISDEPYRELVYGGAKAPWWPDWYANSLVVYSFSKSLSLAGERIGYVMIPHKVPDHDRIVRAVRRAMGKIGYVNAPAIAQRIAGECAKASVDLEYYSRSRDFLKDLMTRLHFDFVDPQGAFYLFLKAPGGDEKRFMAMASERHLIFVGGSHFAYPGYVRVSFCCPYEKLVRAEKAFEALARDCESL